jgi:hypothetical protein
VSLNLDPDFGVFADVRIERSLLMSPWTALLESLHSALIDELVERHPEPKPELGLPLRKTQFALPDPSATAWVLCEVLIEDARGIVVIAMNSDCSRTLNLDAKTLWEAVLKRSGSEFSRRSIRPRVSQLAEPKNTTPFPKGFPEPTRMIWIPIRFPTGSCYLGVGA